MRDRQRDLISVSSIAVDSRPHRNHFQPSAGGGKTSDKNLAVFKACFDLATIGFSVSNLEGRLLEVNPAFCSITGYEETELLSKLEVESLTHPEDRMYCRKRISALLAGETSGVVLEKRYVKKGGQIVWVQNSLSLIHDAEGRPMQIVLLIQDITERKLAEASLHEIQTRNEIILASVSDVHILFDDEWHYTYVNEAAIESIGRPREEILGRTLWEIYPDIVGTELEFHYRRAMELKMSVAFEFHYLTRDTWWENRFHPTASGLAVFATDITERKQAEESLKRSEQELAEAQELATLGSWSWDIKKGLVTWSDELYRIFGLNPQEFRASFPAIIERVHIEDRRDVLLTLDRCIKTRERYNQSVRIVTYDGTIRRLKVLGSVVSDEDGSTVRMFGFCHDVTELENSRDARLVAESKYQEIFENAGEGIFQSTPEGCYLTVNPALAQMHGFKSPEELIRSCRDISHQIYVDPQKREEFKRLLEEHGIVRGFEHQTLRKDGSKIWISVDARAVRGEAGKILYYEGTTRDVTGRKQAEWALRGSEERYRELFENSKDALYVHDLAGRYTSVNRAAERLSGYKREELIGKHFSVFINPDHEARILGKLSKKLTDSSETTYEVEIITKDGRHVPVEVSSRLIFENGQAVAVQGSVRDISERRRAEEASRTYARRVIEAQEAERRHLSLELHDQVGQILTAVKMNLHSLHHKSSSPEILASIEENMDVIDEAVDQVRHLSGDLRPLLLDDFGLVVALRWYLDRQAKHGGIPAEFISRSIDEDDRFSAELETACFRVVQEAITNVVRHARATRISVMLERSDSDLIILIGDNGQGFNINALSNDAAGSGTLGLRGMEERVHAVGGTIVIDSGPGLGTEICARFPNATTMRAFSHTEPEPVEKAFNHAV